MYPFSPQQCPPPPIFNQTFCGAPWHPSVPQALPGSPPTALAPRDDSKMLICCARLQTLDCTLVYCQHTCPTKNQGANLQMTRKKEKKTSLASREI